MKTRRMLASVVNDRITTGNPVADRMIELALEGMPNHTKYQFLTEFPEGNKLLLAEFLTDFITRENIASSTKRVYIHNIHLWRRDVLSGLQTKG